MMLGMGLLPEFKRDTSRFRDRTEPAEDDMSDRKSAPPAEAQDSEEKESHLLKTVGWISAALGAVALGVLVGRELRIRYKFNHQTPYDMYAHSGDEMGDVDWGVGI
jgi:hypothetical protein